MTYSMTHFFSGSCCISAWSYVSITHADTT